MDEPLPLADAQHFIASHYSHRASELTLLGAGEWSRAYAFRLDGEAAVVRFGAHGEDFAKDQIMASFSSPSLPIPKIIEYGKAPQGYFAVSEHAYGVPLDDLDEAGMRAVLPGLLNMMDAIRDIETGAGPFGTAYTTLQSLAGELPRKRYVVHGDLLNRNVLVQGTNLSAVIDWGNALYGDWLYDAAWLLYWWPWYRAWANIDIRAELDQHWQATRGIPTDRELRLRCYQLHIGLDAMTYDAFTGRHDNLAWNAEQALALV